MKTTKKQQKFRVSDRAYCKIISGVIDSMTGCRIDPFTFKQVVTAVSSYLKPEGKITGLGRKAKPIFERIRPDLDLAIRRATTARAAAARRRTNKEESTETAAEPSVQSAETIENTPDLRPKAPQQETPALWSACKKHSAPTPVRSAGRGVRSRICDTISCPAPALSADSQTIPKR